MCVCVHVCMCACVRVYMYVFLIFICILLKREESFVQTKKHPENQKITDFKVKLQAKYIYKVHVNVYTKKKTWTDSIKIFNCNILNKTKSYRKSMQK